MTLYRGKNVALINGYRSRKRGYVAEIMVPDSLNNVSVRFTELTFNDHDAAADAFLKIFSLTPAEARAMGHKKGVPPTQKPKLILMSRLSPKKAVYTIDDKMDNIFCSS